MSAQTFRETWESGHASRDDEVAELKRQYAEYCFEQGRKEGQLLAKLTEAERKLEAIYATKPHAWSVTYGGQHVGNIFNTLDSAKAKRAQLDEDFPSDLRTVIGLIPLPTKEPK